MSDRLPIDLRRFQPAVDAIRSAATYAVDRSDISLDDYKAQHALADELQAIIDADSVCCPRAAPDSDLPLFGPPIPYSPGDELQADVVLAILCLGGCSCAAEIVTRESIKRYDGSVSHYCVPTRRLTR